MFERRKGPDDAEEPVVSGAKDRSYRGGVQGDDLGDDLPYRGSGGATVQAAPFANDSWWKYNRSRAQPLK